MAVSCPKSLCSASPLAGGMRRREGLDVVQMLLSNNEINTGFSIKRKINYLS